jgi:hypothetical protein
MNGDTEDVKGVRGWLLLLCVILTVFDPIVLIASLFTFTDMARPLFARHPEFFRLVLISGVARIAMAVFSLYVGVSLWKLVPGAPRLACRYFMTLAAYSVAVVLLPTMLHVTLEQGTDSLMAGSINAGVTIAYSGAWYIYLTRSRRVHSTYGDVGDTGSQ